MSDQAEGSSRSAHVTRRGGQIGDSSRSAGDSIASALAERVLSGELAADERLPSERRLAVEFGASRPMVREALRSLVERGLIVQAMLSLQGRSRIVAARSEAAQRPPGRLEQTR